MGDKMNLTVAVLSSLFLILISGIAWVIVRINSRRLSRIDDELRAIKVILSEMPNDDGLKEYMFAQDQQLRGIVEKLDTQPSSDVLHQYIHDQANQIIAIISTHDEDRESRVTKTDLEISLRVTNKLLEKVLWSLRFDEDKYVESNEVNTNGPEYQGRKNITRMDTQNTNDCDNLDDKVSMKKILEKSDDSYSALLKFMDKSGKSGTEALHALEATKVMRSR
jgi:hypothetical protein